MYEEARIDRVVSARAWLLLRGPKFARGYAEHHVDGFYSQDTGAPTTSANTDRRPSQTRAERMRRNDSRAFARRLPIPPDG